MEETIVYTPDVSDSPLTRTQEEDDEDWFDELGWLEQSFERLPPMHSSVSVHDQRQFQIKLDCNRGCEAQEQSRSVGLDVYFFVPFSMGVNSLSWSRNQFFQALTTYHRIKTPRRPPWFEEIHDLDIPSAERYFLPGLSGRERQRLEGLVQQDVKLFGCYINTAMKEIQISLRRGLPNSLQGSEIKSRIALARRRVEHFRQRYVGALQKFPDLASVEVRKVFLLMDEYLSYRLESWLIDFAERVKEEHHPQSYLRDFFLKQLEKECTYRLRYITTPSPEGGQNRKSDRQERTQYRLGLLKKFVYQVLYLDRKELKRQKLLFNFMAMIAAALAAAWAAFAALFYAPQLVVRLSEIQTENALRLFAFFVMAVLAYVAKDRIKDWTREYFYRKFSSDLPDREFQVTFSNLNSLCLRETTEVGRLQESMEFVKKTEIAEEVLYIREMESHFDLEPKRQENILHYARRFDFTPLQSGLDAHGTGLIKEVLRFDVSDFLTKLSDPSRSYSYWDEKEGIQHVQAPRVYHLNLVLQYTMDVRQENGEVHRRIEYERVRLVLNKQGILRLDDVVPRAELYLDEVIG